MRIVRDIARPKSADEDSQYSLHLSALGELSALSISKGDHDLLPTEFEDPGGPSDFTQDMANWMRDSKCSRSHQHSAQKAKSEPSPTIVARVCLGGKEDVTHQQMAEEPPKMAAQARRQDLDNSSYCPSGEVATLRNDFQILQRKHDELMIAFQMMASKQSNQHARQAKEDNVFPAESGPRSSDESVKDAILLTQQTEINALRRELALERQSNAAQRRETQQPMHHRKPKRHSHGRETEDLDRYGSRHDSTHDSEHKERLEPPIDGAAPMSGDVLDNSAVVELQSLVHRLQVRIKDEAILHVAEVAAVRNEHESAAREVDAWIVSQVEVQERKHVSALQKKDRQIASLTLRLQEIEALNDRCSKELLLAWGREEFGSAGIGERQQYRYRSG